MSKVALTKENGEGQDERSRKSKMKRRTDGWEAAKAEIAKELGLWASLTAAESGRLGGVLSGRFPGKAPQNEPKNRKKLQNSR